MDSANTTNISPQQCQAVSRSMQCGKTLYRGVRPLPADPGDLGIGTYFFSSRCVAKCYGTAQTHKIQLLRPLVLSSARAYDIIAKRFMTCRGTDASRKVGATAATRVFQCLGFDGVVAVDLREPKRWEVVVFPASQNKPK